MFAPYEKLLCGMTSGEFRDSLGADANTGEDN